MSSQEEIVFGVRPVLEKLYSSADDIHEILISNASDRGALQKINQQAARLKLRVSTVPPEILDRLVGGQRHQGVVAKVEAFRYLSLDMFLERISETRDQDWVLILDSITDPRNFGALVRTAEAVGVRFIVIPKNRAAQVTPTTTKTSAGAVHYVDIVRVPNLRQVIVELKKRGYWVVGLDAASAKSLYGQTYPQRLVVVLGNEGKGVRPINARECDFVVSIPMLGKVGSLNVAVAGAVFMYELVRQSRATRRASASTETKMG